MRDSFVIYTKIIETVEKLTKEQKGDLFQAILDFETGKDVVFDDPIVEIAFIPIRQDLEVNNAKWDEIRRARSEAGKKSAENKKQKSTKATSVDCVKTKTNKAEQTETKSTVYVNDNVNVNVNDNKKPLDGFFDDPELNEAFNKYLEICRNGKKVDFQAVQRKLYDLSKGDVKKMIEILNQSIAQGWSGLYEIRTPTEKAKKNDKIHFSTEREYDFEELERELLSNSG